MSEWPVWALVFLFSLLAQLLKLVTYSLNSRRLLFAAFFQGRGLPSLTGVFCGSLLTLTVMRCGWAASETALALVLTVIVVHDTVKLSGLAEMQREAVVRVEAGLKEGSVSRQAAAVFLDPRVHHPSHVAAGVVLGALFALAFRAQPD